MEAGLPEGRELSVLVVTPFRAQRALYRSCLRGGRHRPGFRLSCSTIHCSQGGEADVVIFDLVDPQNYFVTCADAAHLWCVACSRAREQLFVVGGEWAVRTGRWSGPMLRDVPAQGLPEIAVMDTPARKTAA